MICTVIDIRGDYAYVKYQDTGVISEVAIALYGAYQAKAVTFFNLPTTIITPFAISIIPAISGAEAGKCLCCCA